MTIRLMRYPRRRVSVLFGVLLLAFSLRPALGNNNTAFDYGRSDPGEEGTAFYRPADTAEPLVNPPGDVVRNVILLIGDGMGASQIFLSRLAACGVDCRLHMERMPVVGLMSTQPLGALVTDSAAAGTALACGVRTANGMLGVSPDRKVHQNIFEAAADKGMRTGLVATSTVTHATPAAFASHVDTRAAEPIIASQMLARKINVILGGGKQFWIPQSVEGSKRQDDVDILRRAKDLGYLFVETYGQLVAAQGPHVLGLFQYGHLTTRITQEQLAASEAVACAQDGSGSAGRVGAAPADDTGPSAAASDPANREPTIEEMTRKAIELLNANSPNGFILMVEGSQIDWACHANDAVDCVRQTLLFDMAVKVAVDFAQADGRTLVLVTADHETGGLTITQDEHGNPRPLWSTGGHTALPVPVYAFGPGALEFGGTMDIIDIPRKLAKLLNITPFPAVLPSSAGVFTADAPQVVP